MDTSRAWLFPESDPMLTFVNGSYTELRLPFAKAFLTSLPAKPLVPLPRRQRARRGRAH
jgi:hypothetical protein